MWLDECMEFHRLWSALQFFFCQPPLSGSEGLNQANEALVELVYSFQIKLFLFFVWSLVVLNLLHFKT